MKKKTVMMKVYVNVEADYTSIDIYAFRTVLYQQFC